MFEIRQDNLSSTQTRALLEMHLAGMNANSPPGSVFALNISALRAPNITVWSARKGEQVASIGAYKMLADGNGEVKSMRTRPQFMRMGAASSPLEVIINTGVAHGADRLSLETGSGPSFEPALALYRRRGFKNGDAFGDYRPSEFNQFLQLDLIRAAASTFL